MPPSIPMSEFQAMLAKSEPGAAAGMSAQMGDVSKNSAEINKLNTTLKTVAETMNQVSAALKRVGTDLDGLKNKAEQLNRFNTTFAQQIGKMSRDDIVKLQTAFKGLSGTINQLPEDVKRSLQQASLLIDDFEKKTGTLRSSVQNTFVGGSKAMMQSVGNAVSRELDDLIPPPLQQFGIWGMLIGFVIAAEDRLKVEAAQVLTVWTRATGSAAGSIENVRDRMSAMENTWMNIAKKEDLVKVWKGAAGILDQTGTSIDGLLNKTMDLDVALGVGFGSTIERVSNMTVKYNANARTMISEMSKMGAIFRDNIGPTNVWLQTVMDMQARLGNLGVNTKNLATTFDLFAGASKKMGGGMAQAQTATEELFGFFGKMGLPIQAMMGQALAPGKSAAEGIYAVQKLINLEQGEFGKKMPSMLGGLFERLGLFKMNPAEANLIMQKQLGFSQSTSVIMTELLKTSGGSRKDFEERFAKSDKAQNALGIDTKDVKEMLKAEIPGWTQLLKILVKLATDAIAFIGDLMAGGIAQMLSLGFYVAEVLSGGRFKSPMVDPVTMSGIAQSAWKKRFETLQSSLSTMGGEGLEAAAGLVPGGEIWKAAFGKGKPAGAKETTEKKTLWGKVAPFILNPAGAAFSATSGVEFGGGTAPAGGGVQSGAPSGGGFNMYSPVMPVGGPQGGSPITTSNVAGGVSIEGKFVWTLTDSEAKEFQNALAKAGTTSAPEAAGH